MPLTPRITSFRVANYQGPLDMPMKRIRYSTQYPTRLQFPGAEDFIYVSQSGAETSVDKPLVSEGFSRCIPIIITNPITKKFALLHVDSLDMNINQEIKIKELKVGDQKLSSIIVAGTETWHRAGIRGQFEYLGISIDKEISVETGRYHFAVGFDPLNNTVMVCRKSPSKEILFFNGFK